MNITIQLKDPRFCQCYSLESYCPLRHFDDHQDWCALGYFNCSASGNATYDYKTDTIVETNVDFDDLDNLKDGSYGFTRAEVEGGKPKKYPWWLGGGWDESPKAKMPVCESCWNSLAMGGYYPELGITKLSDTERHPEEDAQCCCCSSIVPGYNARQLFRSLNSINSQLEIPMLEATLTFVADPCYITNQIENNCKIVSEHIKRQEKLQQDRSECKAEIEQLNPSSAYRWPEY